MLRSFGRSSRSSLTNSRGGLRSDWTLVGEPLSRRNTGETPVPPEKITSELTQLPLDVADLLGDLRVIFHVFGHRADGVEDRGVVAAAEVAADFFQAVPCMFAGEVHADLAGEGDGLV